MRAIIVGCGRVGSGLAERLARAGHEVTIIDITADAFARLEADFPGQAVRGDGTDEEVLRKAGAEGAEYFFGLTEGDNRNVLTAQLASETFRIPNVVAKVNDPVRAEAYTTLGLSTICRTRLMVDGLGRFAGLPADPGAEGVRLATGPHHSARSGAAEGTFQPPSESDAPQAADRAQAAGGSRAVDGQAATGPQAAPGPEAAPGPDAAPGPRPSRLRSIVRSAREGR